MTVAIKDRAAITLAKNALSLFAAKLYIQYTR